MQAELWKKVDELFQAALAEAPEKRAEFLNRVCPDDAQVRSEVESLLEQADGSFLEGSPLPSAVRPGMKLGNFEVVQLIGRGGMGEVWRARDPRLKRDVAIKLLPVAFAHDPDRIARFEHEARAASALNHPNIVSVFDVGHENGTWWIVSELVEGESLRSLIDRGPLAPRKAIEIAVQIADGLAAAHAAGIVHRDLKPGNIMVRRDGGVKIVDFGLAKRERPANESATLTDPGTVVGTAGYMSPEQVRGEAVDALSDIFSFGVILYEMLSGRQAFSGKSSVEVMNAILKDDPAELVGVPPALDRIVLRCLRKEREARFQSSADLAFAVGSALGTPVASKPVKRRKWLPPVIAAALLAAAGAIYWAGDWAGRRAVQPAAMFDGKFKKLTNDPGLTTNAAISLDGKLVAYASDRADPSNLDIWVQPVDGGHAIRITDDPADDDEPTFSPDGSQIAFQSERKEPGIYVAPALGGETRLLIPHGKSPRFSPNGKMLMYWTEETGSAHEALFVQALAGGAPARIVDAQPPGTACHVGSDIWSPDSTRILFAVDCGFATHTIWNSTLDGRRVPLALDAREWQPIDLWPTNPPRILGYTDAGDGVSNIAVPISADGTRVTGPWQRITFGAGNESSVSGAANGRIAISNMNSDMHIWAIPIDPSGHARGGPKQLTSGSGETGPALSRDGRGMIFISLPDLDLYYRDLETGKQVQLFSQSVGQAIFSPDGTKIIGATIQGGFSFFEVSISGGIPRRIWTDLRISDPSLWDSSPQGETILYSDDLTGKTVSVHEMDLNTTKTVPFLQDPEYSIYQSHFSHDGKWVAFNALTNGRSRVFATPFRKSLAPRSEWIPITDGHWDDKPRFSYDDRLIFLASDRDGHRCIWAQPIGADMHPVGSPFAVYHAHQRRRSLPDWSDFEMDVGRSMIVVNEEEQTGNVSLLEPAKATPQ